MSANVCGGLWRQDLGQQYMEVGLENALRDAALGT